MVSSIAKAKADLCSTVKTGDDKHALNDYRNLIAHAGFHEYDMYVVIHEEGGEVKPLITYGDKINCIKDLIYRVIMIDVSRQR